MSCRFLFESVAHLVPLKMGRTMFHPKVLVDYKEAFWFIDLEVFFITVWE